MNESTPAKECQLNSWHLLIPKYLVLFLTYILCSHQTHHRTYVIRMYFDTSSHFSCDAHFRMTLWRYKHRSPSIRSNYYTYHTYHMYYTFQHPSFVLPVVYQFSFLDSHQLFCKTSLQCSFICKVGILPNVYSQLIPLITFELRENFNFSYSPIPLEFLRSLPPCNELLGIWNALSETQDSYSHTPHVFTLWWLLILILITSLVLKIFLLHTYIPPVEITDFP